jgi:hypothetical protein
LVEVKVAKEREVGKELSKEEELELFENELKKLREGKHKADSLSAYCHRNEYKSENRLKLFVSKACGEGNLET